MDGATTAAAGAAPRATMERSDSASSASTLEIDRLMRESAAESRAAATAAAPPAKPAVRFADPAPAADLPSDGPASDEPSLPPPPIPSYYADAHRLLFPPGVAVGVPGAKLSLNRRAAMAMARRPWTHLLSAFAVASVLSFVGMRYGEFEVTIDNAGWWSRGTLVADRATQDIMVNRHRGELFSDPESWDELTTVVQPNWEAPAVGEGEGGDGEDDGEEEDEEAKRRAEEEARAAMTEEVCSGAWYGSGRMRRQDNLVAVWKAEGGGGSALEADALYDMCEAEGITLAALEDDGACVRCNTAAGGNRCIQPYSLVLLARLHLLDGDDEALLDDGTVLRGDASDDLAAAIPCDELRRRWTDAVRRDFASALEDCASGEVDRVLGADDEPPAAACRFPVKFAATLVDDAFLASDPPAVKYTASHYATLRGGGNVDAMYDASEAGDYGRGEGSPVAAVYDTTDDDFQGMYADAIVGRDMGLAVGSAGVTVLAMVLHTRSPFLTLVGLFQIILSFPLAYFVYYFAGGLVFFPFLNFIGIFVVFALGADDVFVAVDKWKSARAELPPGTASTEEVAALALPDAAYAMLLTSLTTAVAFFGTAICPVGPIVCFATFCGLLITFDYMMNVLLVFPALCIYDRWLLAGSRNCCVSFDACRRGGRRGGADDEEEDARPVQPPVAKAVKKELDESESQESAGVVSGEAAVPVPSEVGGAAVEAPAAAAASGPGKAERKTLIFRVLDGYYNLLHRFRWLVLAAVVAGIATCVAFAAQLTLPTSSEVALLPESNQYQMHATWSQNLLSTELDKQAGSSAKIYWGVTPADTGDHLNPDSWTTLVLDETFDPRSEAAQTYLLTFCDRMFADFGKVRDEYECPMQAFDAWLRDQSTSESPVEAYEANCAGARGVPVSPDAFDPCIVAWSELSTETAVLQRDGAVRILQVVSKSEVFYDSPFSELKDEWDKFEAFLDVERDAAPDGVGRMFHSDISFWWFDTNQQMLRTAYGAAGIALVAAACVVFVSSRSFVLTFFAGIAIAYVLVAATACLVGLGWELGFLESILFAILIGISCDFVIHTGHAYTMYSGSVNRHHRSHFSLTHMGPSILAAAFTTFMAAVVMVFTEITFFRKFAVMLFMTIVHSVIGCFVVFLVLCDCFGPAEPTKGYDKIKAAIGRG